MQSRRMDDDFAIPRFDVVVKAAGSLVAGVEVKADSALRLGRTFR